MALYPEPRSVYEDELEDEEYEDGLFGEDGLDGDEFNVDESAEGNGEENKSEGKEAEEDDASEDEAKVPGYERSSSQSSTGTSESQIDFLHEAIDPRAFAQDCFKACLSLVYVSLTIMQDGKDATYWTAQRHAEQTTPVQLDAAIAWQVWRDEMEVSDILQVPFRNIHIFQ